jgi:lipopolysaccharide/colanic/teichoic acid biosynthesis glycosyltransferase/glycosyltransferase involved in cell wall biosynthesis
MRIPPSQSKYFERLAWSTGLGPAQRCGATGGILETTFRRLSDVCGSGILLLLAAPLFLITALAVWLTDRGDVFFRQTRAGLLGRDFQLLKFRSMQVNNLPLDEVTEIREGHALVTPVGRWIRRFKVDELPQLMNVLRGDMALIGPRPALPEHVERYEGFQRRRLDIRPGITGWAQVNGGIELTWPERIMLDIWYVDHRSFGLDVRILWQTLGVILFGDERNPTALQEAIAHVNQERRNIELALSPLSMTSTHASRGIPAGQAIPDSKAYCGAQHETVPSNGAADAQASNGRRNTPMLRRVVHLTSAHSTFDVRIFHKECKSLAMAGYDVTIIALDEKGNASCDGVKVRAVARPRNRLERMTRTIWQVYQAAVREQGQIYHFHDPELMPVGALLKTRGKRVIYDAHEDLADDVRHKQWIPALLRWPLSVAVRACEVTFTRGFDRVIAATPMIARKFPAGKTRVVRNFPWTHEFCGSDSLPYEKREAIAVYVGGLSDTNGLREMRKAVELAARQLPIKLVIAGWVNSGVKAEFQRDRESRLVEHKGLLDRSQIAELLARARVGLFLMHPTGNKVNALPVKLFEYMAAGLPAVVSDFPYWRKIIGSAGCGLMVDPLNPAAVAEALTWLFRHPAQAAEMGRNGRRAVLEYYNWERESDCLIATYAELQSAV